MIHQRYRIAAAVHLAGDLVATLLAFLGAWYLRFELEVLPLTKGTPEFARYLDLLPVVLLLFPVVFYFHGLYQSRSNRSRVDEAVSVLLAVVLATVLLSGLFTWYRPVQSPDSTEPFTYSRPFLALFADPLRLPGGRRPGRAALAAGERQPAHRRAAADPGGRRGQARSRRSPRSCSPIATSGSRWSASSTTTPARRTRGSTACRCWAPLGDLERVLAERKVEQIFVALPLEAHKKMMKVLAAVGSECVEVKLVPDILQYATIKATLEDLDGTPVINLSQVPLQGWNSLVKRVMDLALAAVGLIVLAPFLPLVALGVWLEDRGPVLYGQERMGLDGRVFRIFKFRSMRVDAEATTGPVWAVQDDPRRTRFGGFLRRWSIDELPQLWNVLVGDMSLVGPAPGAADVRRGVQAATIPQYMLRHRVKSGITGWAQVHGWRGNTSIRKRLEYDLYYIENWSLGLDFKILWMTVRHGIRHNAH